MAHAGFGDEAAAAAARVRAVDALRPVVDSLEPGDLLDAFRARPDVAEVLSWERPGA